MRQLLNFCTIYLMLCTFFAQAQKQGQEKIDSLLTVLSNCNAMQVKSGNKITIADTNKVNLLTNLSFNYYSVNPDEGIKYGMQALVLAEKLNWKKAIANAENTIGINYAYGKSDFLMMLSRLLILHK